MTRQFTKFLLAVLAFAPLANAQTGFLQSSGQIFSSIPPAYLTQFGSTAAAMTATYANSGITANQLLTFADGTPAYQAGTNYTGATYISDTAQTMMANPYNFKPTVVLKYLSDFDSKKDASGNFPIAINISGTTETANFYSAWDTASPHKFVTGDGWIFMPWLAKVHYLITNNTTAYTTYVADMKTALNNVPKDTNGLVLVTPGSEFVACFGFQEYMRKTGDDACASVFLATDYQFLSQLASVAGDSANVTYFNNLLNTIKTSIDSTFVDATTGLLKAATIQNSGNLDVESSALACYYNILSAARCSTISNYFSTNYSTLVNGNGFIRVSPTAWATVGYIGAGGGTPYGASGFSGTQYQGGYWPQHFAWFAHTLGINYPNAIANLIQTYINAGAARSYEWNDVGSLANPGSSSAVYMNSTAGPLAASAEFPFPVNAANPFFAGYETASGSVTSIIPNASNTNRHIFAQNSASIEVLDLYNANPNGPVAFGFIDSSGNTNSGFGYGNSGMSQAWLRNSLYRYNATAGGTVCDTTEVGTQCDLLIDASHKVSTPGPFRFGLQGTLWSTGSAGGGLSILEQNATASLAGVETLIDTANPASRVALTQAGAFIVQTAPATAGSPAWTTQTTITSTGSLSPRTSTVASLPTASSEGAGALRIVTDATATTGGACTGGGTNYSVALSTGSVWTCH